MFWQHHPDKAKLQGLKASDWAKIHRNEILQHAINNSLIAKQKRIQSDFSILISALHPDDITDLLNGNILTESIIRTKCPLCNNYAEHSLHNVFIFSKFKFKNNRPPLCPHCTNALITSYYEQEISDYIATIVPDICIRNNRTIIKPQELDLYYPEKKTAIEFNGDYFHSNKFKPDNYHYNKFIQCRHKGVTLVSIFESEWNTNKDTIKEYLKDLFNNKENNLSFNDDRTLMNNNYPAINININKSDNILNNYKYQNYTVYTCGYSNIIK